jgi:signal peptidase II
MLVLTLAFAVAALDQWTKQMVRDHLAYGELRALIPGFFNLTYLRNTGAAWGLFGGQNIGLVLLSIVMLLAIIRFRRSFLTDSLSHRAAFGCMIGGIVGNLLDRVRLGYVVDFLDFHWGARHFPAFNVADSAICIGVGIYIATSFIADRAARRAAAPAI